MGNQVVFFEILGKDGAKLQRFYADLFGWSIDANNPMNYGMVPAQGQGIDGGVAGGEDNEANVKVYVQADDLQAALDKAVRLGGKVVLPITDVPGGPTIAQFSDPDGNVIGLTRG